MGKFLNYVDKVSRITEEDQDFAIRRILRENSFYAVDLLTMQLMEGMDGDGQPLEHYRSIAYAEMKLEFNPRGVTDLRLSGDFHESIFMTTTAWPLEFDASDWKKAHLVNIYGKAILQLNEKSINLLVDQIRKEVIDYYRNLLRL